MRDQSMRDATAMQIVKRDLRKRTLSARDQLSPDYRKRCSEGLIPHINVFDDVSGKTVSGFWPIRSEIDARPLMYALKERGALLALPVVVDETTIEFRSFEDDDHLIDAGFGTKGPAPDAKIVNPDIMLVPLSVFDMYGGRIGYGAGYYDRAIMRLVDNDMVPFCAGLSFALQEVPCVPQDDHDISLDCVLTHEGVIIPEPRPLFP